MKKERNCLTLFTTFFKIGAFTFGGGYAMISLIETEVCENHKWATKEDILDMLAIAESTPGVIAVNSATFIGYKVAGFWGAFFATLGVVIPSFIIISLISLFYAAFRENRIISYAFDGIKAGVVVIMLGAIIKFSKNINLTLINLAILTLAFVLASFTEIDVIFIIIGVGLLGLFMPFKSEGEGN